MKPMHLFRPALWILLFIFIAPRPAARAAETVPAPPRITSGQTTNGQLRLIFPYPAAQQYNIFSAPDAGSLFAPDTNSGKFLGPT